MGMLVEGTWHDVWYNTAENGGRFVRKASAFRNQIVREGGDEDFVAEANRYHLYVSLACPWAHRTLIMRQLKGLEDLISVSIVHPDMLEKGWTFGGEQNPWPGATEDHLFGSKHMYEVYTRAQSDYSGRVTVPVLWDKKQQTIVNNESAEIIRIFNTAFNHLTGNTDDYYPEQLRKEIDEINDYVYDRVNNGVYKAGFATTQEAYTEAVHRLFEGLDTLEERLSKQRYLAGDVITEADWRAFTTLVRFDPVYVGHFKCNLRRIADYPNLNNYMRELYAVSGVASTVNIDHIKRHYYYSHANINPTRVVPEGPVLDYDAPHDRDRAYS